MASTTFSSCGLNFELEETPQATVVHCSGKIIVRSAEMFQSEICGRAIPASRGKGVAHTCRIVLDLSNVTYIDGSGLEALFAIWKAAQSRSCEVEIANLSARAGVLTDRTRVGQAFNKIKGLFNTPSAAEKVPGK